MRIYIKFFFIGLMVFIAYTANGQNCKNEKSKKNKNIVKMNKKSIRNELEKQYAKSITATMNKDSLLACSLIHPESKVYAANGEIWDANKLCEYIKLSFIQVQKTIKVSFDLDTIQVHGDTAAVLIHQYWNRSQMKAGKIRDIETTADQWETWVKKDGVYLHYKVDRVVPKIWKVDGKRVDPSKRYDPNAPEFNPDS